MPHVKIADIPFNSEDMDDTEMALLETLRCIDRKIAAVQDHLAVYQTAYFAVQHAADISSRSDTSGVV